MAPIRISVRALGTLALAALTSAHATDTPYAGMEPALRRVCEGAPAYPPGDQPPPTQPACDAIAAYYGIGEPANPARALACAYAGKDYDVIAMLYANGQGVPRNYGVARRATCDAEGAPAEIEGRLAHLSRLEKQDAAKAGHFDFCDDITSGLMMGHCAQIAARRADQHRGTRLMEITVHWSNEGKSALSALLLARDAYIAQRDAELDLGGTDRGAVIVAEEEELRQSFLALIERAQAGTLADVSPARAHALDAQLNASWRRLKATTDPASPYGVKLADILAAQRAWLRYRDAWVALGQQCYPRVSASTWVAVLTEQRNRQLAELLAER